MNNKYAIYGGTFDPIHVGHIALADAAVKECGLYRLIFMPDFISPFKQGRKTASGKDRYEMIRRILHYNDSFTISSYEILNEEPSYTIETLEYWDKVIDGELSFVLGYDSIIEIDTWMRAEDILKKFPLITAKRPDTDYKAGTAKIDSMKKKYGADITVLDMPPIDASSSEIRKRIKNGQSISDITYPEVEDYIREHKLYK